MHLQPWPAIHGHVLLSKQVMAMAFFARKSFALEAGHGLLAKLAISSL
jgi:hypothetical protein